MGGGWRTAIGHTHTKEKKNLVGVAGKIPETKRPIAQRTRGSGDNMYLLRLHRLYPWFGGPVSLPLPCPVPTFCLWLLCPTLSEVSSPGPWTTISWARTHSLQSNCFCRCYSHRNTRISRRIWNKSTLWINDLLVQRNNRLVLPCRNEINDLYEAGTKKKILLYMYQRWT